MSDSLGHAALRQVLAHQNLSVSETERLFGSLMDGEISEVMKTALLIGLAVKGESASEVAGACRAMRERVVKIPHSRIGAVDTCGTGGDGKGTFNISTAAALVAAAAGVVIAKHGNRSVSSKSGSADVLEELGVDLGISAEEAGKTLDEVGISFLFAPKLHPAMKEVMPIRRELGVRTIFNVLGPLTNPAGAKHQVMGVFRRDLVRTIGDVLLELGTEHALVVHGSDGLDEITTTGPTLVAEIRHGRVRTFDLNPSDFDVPLAQEEDLLGGDPKENAAMMRAVLNCDDLPGRHGAPRGKRLREITALNAGAAIYVGGAAESIAEGYQLACSVLETGAAARKLEELCTFKP